MDLAELLRSLLKPRLSPITKKRLARYISEETGMYNFTTKEEVDFEYFKELLWNNEFEVINREWTEEEKAELSREIAKRRAMREDASASVDAEATEAASV